MSQSALAKILKISIKVKNLNINSNISRQILQRPTYLLYAIDFQFIALNFYCMSTVTFGSLFIWPKDFKKKHLVDTNFC